MSVWKELPELMLVREVAGIFRVRPETVRKMIASGELEAVRFGTRGDFRIPASAVRNILNIHVR